MQKLRSNCKFFDCYIIIHIHVLYYFGGCGLLVEGVYKGVALPAYVGTIAL